MHVPRRNAKPPLGLVARTLARGEAVEGLGVPHTAVFISDPLGASEPPHQAISRLFGLTPTEAKLSLLLASGSSMDEAAERLSVSRNTTRTHLRSVFAKTGVSRQAGLVRLILSSVAALAGTGQS